MHQALRQIWILIPDQLRRPFEALPAGSITALAALGAFVFAYAGARRRSAVLTGIFGFIGLGFLILTFLLSLATQ